MTFEYTDLMTSRIRRILLVCNNYDNFALEEDGHLDAQITKEYSELNLSNPPSITRVENTVEALELASVGESFDLVITLYNVGEVDVFDFSRRFKQIAPDTPVVLLTSFAREVYKQLETNDTSFIDYIFCWNNSTDLIIAIIKLLEDRANADRDILEGSVRTILLVEDSIRYYSTYLPLLYRLVFQQNNISIRDALNEKQQAMRKRSRPKILLATCYSEAVALYEKYKSNIMGIISDIGFVINKGDSPDTEKNDAGIDLCRLVRKDDPTIPFLLQSSQESMREVADMLGVGFINKRSSTLTHEVGEYINRECGFGDFIVCDPETGLEHGRARDLYEFERLIKHIPAKIYLHFASNNYLSRWIFARGLYDIGKKMEPIKVETEEDVEEARKYTVSLIHDYRISQALGVVAAFNKDTYNDAIWFSRLGNGSLGGKARGLAFLNFILQKYGLYDKWEDVRVLVPRTLVITTDYFDRFIQENGLQHVINSNLSDEELLSEFVESNLPAELTEALKVFLQNVRKPLAIRSSSKLEDSYYQPFAGVYSTYMIPHVADYDQKLRLLSKAVKSVYASVYFSASRGYITASANVLSEEKMAIVIQEICGSKYDEYFYPTLSGVARSYNFYPVGMEKPEEGICKVAFGLGKAVVDGDQVLRFSPKYPKHALQTSTPELIIKETQQHMFALYNKPEMFRTSIDDAVNLKHIPISECTGFRTFDKVVSTWDIENRRMVDSGAPEGPKYVTFAQMLKYNSFPLADIVRELLDLARKELGGGVEIEFAADLDRNGKKDTFNVLQIRPISFDSSSIVVDWEDMDCEGSILRSSNALGTGWLYGVQDIVYLKESSFDTMKTAEIAAEMRVINNRMQAQKRNYVLIGFGRWGSSIPSLGVPVQWSDISEAKVIVECCLDNFRVEPSQGTHFFQNLTSFNVGYVNVNPYSNSEDKVDFGTLDSIPAEEETKYARVIHLDKPLEICIDGHSSQALIKISK